MPFVSVRIIIMNYSFILFIIVVVVAAAELY